MIDSRLAVLGTGAALPGEPIRTRELLAGIESRFNVRVERLGARLGERLGIDARHFSRDFERVGEGPRPGDSNPDLAARAAAAALVAAGLHANSLEYLLGHTATPHTLVPPNASWVAERLGYDGPYAELRQACTGCANALQMGAALIGSPASGPVCIVGSETGSVFLDPRNVGDDHRQLLNLVQMGDGAGAIVLGPDGGNGGPTIRHAFYGVLPDAPAPGLALVSGGSARPCVPGVLEFEHDYELVRRRGTELIRAGLEAIVRAGVDVGAIDWFLPHQVNARLPEHLERALGIPRQRCVVDCDRVGNLGSASIWVALHRLIASGRLRPGATVLALGAEATKHMFGGFVYRHS